MITFNLKIVRRVLCLGAHSDDIEIGCGGTILKLIQDQPELEVLWVVFSAGGTRTREARLIATNARTRRTRTHPTWATLCWFIPLFGVYFGIKELQRAMVGVGPHHTGRHPTAADDRHQDHRVLSDLAWNTFRDHLILEYEIPKYDGDLGNPNIFVQLAPEVCQRKTEHLCAFFQTQNNKHWFTPDTFLSLMRLRGIECASPTKFAEAFYGRKLVV